MQWCGVYVQKFNLRLQGLAGLRSCEAAVASLQILDHHLAESVVHVHLEADIFIQTPSSEQTAAINLYSLTPYTTINIFIKK